MKVTCEDCGFFEKTTGVKGLCHKNPPVVLSATKSTFPVIDDYTACYCGAFQAGSYEKMLK